MGHTEIYLNVNAVLVCDLVVMFYLAGKSRIRVHAK